MRVRVVRRRGELMYESGVEAPGAMAAILGDIESRPIEEICAEATREAGLVVPANYNCPGQARDQRRRVPASSARWCCARKRARSARCDST